MSNLIHTEVRDGFTIKFFAEEDNSSLRELGFESDAVAEIRPQIDSGDLVLFSAKVTASRNSIELASEYLGGCIYADEKDFVNNNDYYGDMVATVIESATQAIEDLTKGDE